ncbi:potassium transporter Kup [Novosphingobium sp. Fuku2-ISO-50]|jgi:KUP system potassium uptake protein|uniref:potassium transporter Kup n=1 Tax=Novosphingobium sp. Fuku2-ISO-50 TaxID=1739114 RepID=UPI0009E97A18|nr:potassium transporter Kup [Novosphingobium sp. Fuku2-ISO-50]
MTEPNLTDSALSESTLADLASNDHHKESLSTLAVGAIGVVFGDIGTSPLYSLRESFIGAHPLAVDPAHIFGVLSLIFWTMTLIVTVKYVFVILHADNKGEGGSLALLALIGRRLGQNRWTSLTVLLGIIATALFYGDAIITPAMSVLSAVEGLEVVQPAFAKLVLPISIAILIGLFAIQSRGTAAVGKLFGPVMLVYFAVIAVLGIMGIMQAPEILWSINPLYAVRFFAIDPMLSFLALGSVILAVTGAEALYADMGHFGRKAIMLAWLWVAFPCLLINYMGQSALLLRNPKLVENPFFLMAPDWARLPLVILATLATIIASQAVISGAYSISQQAIQLGFLPRIRILHTSAKAAGQIYVPLVNWLLLALVLLLVVGFKSSNNLASAYGIAVTGTMFITACMLGILTFAVWKWPPVLAAAMTSVFLIVDGAYFASNVTKIPDGGWFPLMIAAIVFVVLTTWSTGRRILRERLAEDSMPFDLFLNSVCDKVRRVPGTSVFLSSTAEGIPPALLHNLKHNHILHERVVILTVVTEGVPHVPSEARRVVEDIGHGFYRMIIRIGFMDEADIPAELALENRAGGAFKPMETSYFLARQTLIASKRPGMALWREKLFAWMIRNAESAMQFFRLPTNRVIELGSQLEI